jgi:hypothetical protein
MFLQGKCWAKCLNACNVLSMFPLKSRYPRPQCLVFSLCYALIVLSLSFISIIVLVINTLLVLLLVILFNVFTVSPEAPIDIVKAFPSSGPRLSVAV